MEYCQIKQLKKNMKEKQLIIKKKGRERYILRRAENILKGCFKIIKRQMDLGKIMLKKEPKSKFIFVTSMIQIIMQ